jgi:trk system potassium uptake protein TrkH
MQVAMIIKILGMLLVLFGLTFFPPIWVDQWYQEGHSQPFVLAFLITFVLGIVCWFPYRRHLIDMSARDGFLITVIFWAALGLIGAIPFYLNAVPHLSIVDSVFESVSGLTTTGATVITHLDNQPHAILYYRQQLQFFGGLGFIILAVAILPMLGVGGMQLFHMEMSGPIKDHKLTPRITQTAKTLWLLYLGITILCSLSYKLCGMGSFDAICYAMATVSSGGFAPHDASMGFFPQISIKITCIFFMCIAAINHGLHYAAFFKRDLSIYLKDTECSTFFGIIAGSFILFWLTIYVFSQSAPGIPIIDVLFQIVSFITTTGFLTTNHSLWPFFMPLFLLYLGLLGGCAGSTSGGFKIIRVILLLKQGLREIRRLIHPHGHFVIKMQKQAVPSRITDAIWGFSAIYIALFSVLLMILLIFEADFLTAYSALITTISNTGPGLGNVALDFHALSTPSKWILSIAMIAGRLEILTLLVLFSPHFWRK